MDPSSVLRPASLALLCATWGCGSPWDTGDPGWPSLPPGEPGETLEAAFDLEGDAHHPDGPVQDHPRRVAAGGAFYLVGDLVFTDVTVDAGTPEECPAYHGALGFGVYRLPASVPPGTRRLGVRDADGLVVDQVTMTVVEPWFRDVAATMGVTHVHDPTGWTGNCTQSLTGQAVADFDGDGDVDLWVSDVGAGGRLFRNDGDRTGDGLPDFVDVTAAVGLAAGDMNGAAVFVDYDGDGDEDLFVARRGGNQGFRNELVPSGTATFVEIAPAPGPTDPLEQRTQGLAWGDWDGDADLDLLVVNHAWCRGSAPTQEASTADHLYRNDGGVFTDVTSLLGDVLPARLAYGAVFVDVDLDDDQDLLVVNDASGNVANQTSLLWRNDGPDEAAGWRFTLDATSGLTPTRDSWGKDINAMGVDIGDLNRDGRPDFVVTNIGPNLLLLSGRTLGGPWGWGEFGGTVGVDRAEYEWGSRSITWGPHLADFDNDGDLDLYLSAGPITGTDPHPNALFENDGAGGFVDRTWESGLAEPGPSKSTAIVDIDADGFLDVVVVEWGGPVAIYRNQLPDQGSRAHWLQVVVAGNGTTSNRAGLGARVSVVSRGDKQLCWVTPRPSMGGGGQRLCHFGLGQATQLQALEVVWPDGTVTVVPTSELPAVDQRITITQP